MRTGHVNDFFLKNRLLPKNKEVVFFMLLKFAYQDFLDDRRFKNTTKTNIVLGWFDKSLCVSIKHDKDITKEKSTVREGLLLVYQTFGRPFLPCWQSYERR